MDVMDAEIKKICPNCGSDNEESSDFCIICGSSLKESGDNNEKGQPTLHNRNKRVWLIIIAAAISVIIFLAGRFSAPTVKAVQIEPDLRILSQTITLVLPEEKKRMIGVEAVGALPEKYDFKVLETSGSGFVGIWSDKKETLSREYAICGVSEGEGTIEIGLIDVQKNESIATCTINVRVVDTRDKDVAGTEPEVIASIDELSIGVSEKYEAELTVSGNLPRSYHLNSAFTGGDLLGVEWSDKWENHKTKMTISGIRKGSGTVVINLIDDTTGFVIASTFINISIV